MNRAERRRQAREQAKADKHLPLAGGGGGSMIGIGMSPDFAPSDYGMPKRATRQWVVENSTEDEGLGTELAATYASWSADCTTPSSVEPHVPSRYGVRIPSQGLRRTRSRPALGQQPDGVPSFPLPGCRHHNKPPVQIPGIHLAIVRETGLSASHSPPAPPNPISG